MTIQMGFRREGQTLQITSAALAKAIPDASGKILVMVHGHCMNELQWRRNGHDHGEVLAAANGYTPMYLRYNTGLHISKNGRAFAQPTRRTGASLAGAGGRNLHRGLQHGWPGGAQCLPLRRAAKQLAGPCPQLIFIGTPHHGSMVEQAGNMIDWRWR
ncbi:MAG: hypothetical protein IPN06_00380 [Burkholderiales bacterium]|nr:hypothetical protein [Burkholderiales bacterium]